MPTYVVIRGDKIVRSWTGSGALAALSQLKPDKHELVFLRVGGQPDPVPESELKPFTVIGRMEDQENEVFRVDATNASEAMDKAEDQARRDFSELRGGASESPNEDLQFYVLAVLPGHPVILDGELCNY